MANMASKLTAVGRARKRFKLRLEWVKYERILTTIWEETEEDLDQCETEPSTGYLEDCSFGSDLSLDSLKNSEHPPAEGYTSADVTEPVRLPLPVVERPFPQLEWRQYPIVDDSNDGDEEETKMISMSYIDSDEDGFEDYGHCSTLDGPAINSLVPLQIQEDLVPIVKRSFAEVGKGITPGTVVCDYENGPPAKKKAHTCVADPSAPWHSLEIDNELQSMIVDIDLTDVKEIKHSTPFNGEKKFENIRAYSWSNLKMSILKERGLYRSKSLPLDWKRLELDEDITYF